MKINHLIYKFISENYARKLLRQLEKKGDVKKEQPVKIDGIEYHEYFITDNAREELKAISKSTNGGRSSPVKTKRIDNEVKNFVNELKIRTEKVIREFLPEGQRCTDLLQNLTDEIQNCVNKKFNLKI